MSGTADRPVNFGSERAGDLEIAGRGSPKKHPTSYIRDPKRQAKVRQHHALCRQAINAMQTPADRLAILEARGHGHCAEAERLRAVVAPPVPA